MPAEAFLILTIDGLTHTLEYARGELFFMAPRGLTNSIA